MHVQEHHGSQLYHDLSLESATLTPTPSNPHHSTVIFTLVIPSSLCNVIGTLHGGAVALILDLCTSTAINGCSEPEFWDGQHVSRSLNCTYLRGASKGEKIWIECEVVSMGKRLALTRGVIRNEEGKICYTCDHDKVHIGGPKF